MHVNNYVIDTSQFNPLLHDEVVEEFEERIAAYVGARYACAVQSATMAIFMCLLEKEKQTITIPSIIPPVVPNAIICAGHALEYRDDVGWVGHSYVLHDFGDYKVIDSAQQLDKKQFADQADDQDLMIFSFYPTKPVGSIDGGMIVSNDKEKIDRLKILTRYGMTQEKNSWERKIVFPGWKLYMNSIQAYVGLENFKKLESKMERVDEIREIYNAVFGLSNTSRHLYRLRVKSRDEVVKHLKEKGIQCGIHYKLVHEIGCYKSATTTHLPKSEVENQQTLSIPYHEQLTDDEIEAIVKEVQSVSRINVSR